MENYLYKTIRQYVKYKATTNFSNRRFIITVSLLYSNIHTLSRSIEQPQ